MSEPQSPPANHTANGKSRTVASSPLILPPDRPPPGGSERVLAAFQETMRTFLEVQRTTMLAYLSGRPPELRTEHPAVSPPSPIDSPRPTLRLHGDLGASPGLLPRPFRRRTGVRSASSRPTREAIAAELLRIVRDRTGYPLEVLKLELDVEADLGIDSIKRVEILGKLRDTLPGSGRGARSDAMETLARAKTLGAIVDRVERILGQSPVETARSDKPLAQGAPSQEVETSFSQAGLRRLLLEAVDAPLRAEAASLLPGGMVLVTDDGRGAAAAIVQGLNAKGYRTRILGGPDSGMDWTSPASIERSCVGRERQGPVAGLIHALPLRSAGDPGIDRSAWADRMSAEVRGLFLLAKGLAQRPRNRRPAAEAPA